MYHLNVYSSLKHHFLVFLGSCLVPWLLHIWFHEQEWSTGFWSYSTAKALLSHTADVERITWLLRKTLGESECYRLCTQPVNLNLSESLNPTVRSQLELINKTAFTCTKFTTSSIFGQMSWLWKEFIHHTWLFEAQIHKSELFSIYLTC